MSSDEGSGGWKSSVKATQEDLQRLQDLDAALTEEQAVVENIERTLSAQRRGSVARSNSFNSRVIAAKNSSANVIPNSSVVPTSATKADLSSMADIYGDMDLSSPGHDAPVTSARPTSARRGSALIANPMNGHGSPVAPEKISAPETADRFSRAKVQLLAKQLNDANELRVKLEEQVKGLQKQLNTSREENKTSAKRVQQLELELRKSSKKTTITEPSADSSLVQEVNTLKKEMETAERIAKQADANAKNKDTQLKRALETINRLKTQLQESQQQVQSGTSGDTAKVETLESRVRLLEKQRGELIEGFRKQMKLIDVLKRQKLHLEAARLLAFTEEEFMKSLDWNA